MKTTEQRFLDEKPEGRLFAVIFGVIVLFIGAVICMGTIWCIACGVVKLIEIIK